MRALASRVTASYKRVMNRLNIAVALAALLAGTAPCGAQTTVRQETLSVQDVLSGKVKQTDIERDALKETKRHNREVEKVLRKMSKDDRFRLGGGRKVRQTRTTNSLPPNAKAY